MSSQDAINHLLARFSSVLHIAPPLTLDAAGVCAFAYNNEASIAVEVPEQSSQVYLIGTVMPKPAHEGAALAALYERLLKLNLFSSDIRGASIALDPHSGEVLLCYQHPVSALDETGFYNLLTHFTQTVQALRVSLDQASASAETGHLDPLGSARFFNQRA
ncbi:MAG: CesT family type III secretion system chaperone [Betaproteobacteria bacterium]|nr:CesT family type III secretion system chaperone [Betaproteobacteria bacterium]